MMKKLLVLLLALALVLTFTGCLAQPAETNDAASPALSQQDTQAETEVVTESPTQAPTEAPAKSQTKEEEKISEKKAKEVALEHAGLKEADVTALFVELDYDDGILRYEVDFHHGGYEYDYDIDAKTGKVLSHDKDYDD